MVKAKAFRRPEPYSRRCHSFAVGPWWGQLASWIQFPIVTGFFSLITWLAGRFGWGVRLRKWELKGSTCCLGGTFYYQEKGTAVRTMTTLKLVGFFLNSLWPPLVLSGTPMPLCFPTHRSVCRPHEFMFMKHLQIFMQKVLQKTIKCCFLLCIKIKLFHLQECRRQTRQVFLSNH